MLGAIVYWTMNGVKVDRAEFRAKMTEVGLYSAVPKDPSAKRRLTKALADWKRQVGDRWGFRRLDHSDQVAVLRYEQADGAVVKATHCYTVGPGFACGHEPTVVEELEGSSEAVALLRECCANVSQYLGPDEMAEILSTALAGARNHQNLGAIMLRPSGGVYFVSAPKLNQLGELSDMLAGHGIKIYQYLIDSQGENFAHAKASVNIAITDELLELREQIRQLAVDSPDGEAQVTKAIERRKVALRSKVTLWKDILGNLTDRMLDELEVVATEVTQSLEPAEVRVCMFANGPELEGGEAKARAIKALSGGGDAIHVVGEDWFVDFRDHPVLGTGSLVFRPGEAHRFRDDLTFTLGDDVSAYVRA